MATRIRIIGVPVQGNREVWVVDHVLWWPVEKYVQEIGHEDAIPGFRESVDSTLYFDYVGIFNKEEFVRLNDSHKAEFLADARRKPVHAEQQKRMSDIDDYLKQRQDTKWILVEQYEWESGMN
ncbi:MAG: hypothetical protein ACOYZ6_05810 [Chloroflexota bacterium]